MSKAAIEQEQNEVYFDYAEREQARDAVSMSNVKCQKKAFLS
jgi:hypothetical protein